MMKKLSVFLILAILFLSFVSCSSARETEDGGLIANIEGTNIHYRRYENYMAVSVKIGTTIAKTQSAEYYMVSGLDVKEYLCTHPDMGSVIYCKESMTLPQLDGFNPNEVYVCLFSSDSTVAYPLEHEAVLHKIVEQMINNDVIAMPTVVHQSFILNFVSEDYPYLYYSLRFVVDRQGNGYLIDRQNNRCIRLTDDVTQALL